MMIKPITLFATALTIFLGTAAQAQLLFEIERIDDNTVSITGSGTLVAPHSGIDTVRFIGASSQVNDSSVPLSGDLSLGGNPFIFGGTGGTDSIDLIYTDELDVSAGDGLSGVGGFTETRFNFTVAPIGTTGDVTVLTRFTSTVIGSYTVVPEPTSLALLGLGGLLTLRRRR